LITDEPEAGSVEITPNVTAELNNKGKLIGIEIINAKSLLPNFLLLKNRSTQN
jgi:uncharacterized protein YuzE